MAGALPASIGNNTLLPTRIYRYLADHLWTVAFVKMRAGGAYGSNCADESVLFSYHVCDTGKSPDRPMVVRMTQIEWGVGGISSGDRQPVLQPSNLLGWTGITNENTPSGASAYHWRSVKYAAGDYRKSF